MLASQGRCSIYDILCPPGGHSFDALVVCTYSAALDTVLSLPGAIVTDLLGTRKDGKQQFGPSDLAALKGICDRTMVFCQAGGIHAASMLPPAIIEVEPMVYEVVAPNGGAFHPKLWVMRFIDEKERSTVRVAVLSRNLTGDRSWDIGLVAEGRPGAVSTECEVSLLLRKLPGLGRRTVAASHLAILEELAEQAARVAWRMPGHLGKPRFQAIGIRADDQWKQPPSDRLLLLSPFLAASALGDLTKDSKDAMAIISRPDAIDRCWPEVSKQFRRIMVLDPPAEGGSSSAALHGKALIWERGARVFAAVGSMNATRSATAGLNVEFMVSFDCTAEVGAEGIDHLLGHKSLGAVAQDYAPADPSAALTKPFDDRRAKKVLTEADLKLFCEREADGWRVSLVPGGPLGPDVRKHLPSLRFRLATMASNRGALCGDRLARGESVALPGMVELKQITGFVTFEAGSEDRAVAFCLNIPVEGIDAAERSAAVVRDLLPDRAGFYDFVRGMLGDLAGRGGDGGGGEWEGAGPGWSSGPRPGLLELLVRTAADDPETLSSIRRTLDALEPGRLEAIAPAGFMRLWAQLHAAMAPL
ncbi:MAG: phospholipase D family protein [Sphingomonas sp.]|uniref:phospholipase D family protein n=1 Tax=Sphingomonas sp. TaxID=28214 RepID=UPI003F805DC9